MNRYLSGSPEAVEHCGEILGYFQKAGIGVVGSFGRLATFADAGIEVPPLEVMWWNPEDPARTLYRDIDALPQNETQYKAIQVLRERTWHNIDVSLAGYFDMATSQIYYYANGCFNGIPVEPEALRLHERDMDGIRVLTFSGGTLEAIMAPWIVIDPAKADRHARIAKQMKPLFAHLRQERPDEFLPTEAYEPFKEVTEKGELRIGLPLLP